MFYQSLYKLALQILMWERLQGFSFSELQYLLMQNNHYIDTLVSKNLII